MPPVTEEILELDGQPVRLRRAGDDAVPALYLHGVPTSSDDWVAFLERGGGLAPDLPGFGRSGKRGDLDYTMHGQARFVGRLLDHLGIERVRLCVHDWGAAGLLWAMAEPERVERLVVVNAVPFLPGYRWHRWARAWRTPAVGEVAVGLMTPWVLRRALPRPLGDEAAAHFDQGTQRAILRLYRGADPDELARAGKNLARIAAPALVLWGARDPYIDPRFASGYAAALGDATAEIIDGAGHWPWLGRPEVIERIVTFLGS